jgi:hypothetical protein
MSKSTTSKHDGQLRSRQERWHDIAHLLTDDAQIFA